MGEVALISDQTAFINFRPSFPICSREGKAKRADSDGWIHFVPIVNDYFPTSLAQTHTHTQARTTLFLHKDFFFFIKLHKTGRAASKPRFLFMGCCGFFLKKNVFFFLLSFRSPAE